MATKGRPRLHDRPDRVTFSLSSIFPVRKDGGVGPLPKQQQIFDWTASGDVQGGGLLYQGGKGAGKSICGAAWIVWAHHQPQWKGLTSLIGRETFPALMTSTAAEFFTMVKKLPDKLVRKMSEPSKNSMGYVEWEVGGITWLCSLSDASNWESANLGAVWVDEGHRQQESIMKALLTRIRQIEGPRVMLVTSNPGGKNWLWKMASPESKYSLKRWRMIVAATDENAELPDDYHDRLIDVYGLNTPAYNRWVKGLSSALEGVVFPNFDPNPETMLHVIPPFPIPDEWHRSRGMDYGQSAPTVAVYGAQAPWGDWFIMRTHSKAGWTIPMHAEVIRTLDEELKVFNGPGDPTMFHKVHQDRSSGIMYAAADFFFDEGVQIYPGTNDRKAGLALLMQLIAPDSKRQHPITGEQGAPGLYIFATEENEPLIQCFSNLLWDKPEGTPNRTGPDDAQKKDDHEYDAARYLVMDRPTVRDDTPVQGRVPVALNSRGSYRGY